MRADAQKNRRKILQTATLLIRRQEFRKTTMAQIAKEAKVGIGTLYRNFATKDELYLALLYAKIDEYTRREEQYLQNHPVNLSTIKRVLADYLAFREERLNLFPPAALEAAQNYYQGKNYQNLVKLFSRLFQQYKKTSAPEALFQADMLAAALRSDAYYYQRRGRHLTQNEILNGLLNLFFKQKKS